MYTRAPKITCLNCQKELKGSGSYRHFKFCNEKYGMEGNPRAHRSKSKSHHGTTRDPVVVPVKHVANSNRSCNPEIDWLALLTDKNLIYKINGRLTVLHNDKTTIENEIGLLQRVKNSIAATIPSPEPSPGSMESAPIPDVSVLRTHDVLDK